MVVGKVIAQVTQKWGMGVVCQGVWDNKGRFPPPGWGVLLFCISLPSCLPSCFPNVGFTGIGQVGSAGVLLLHTTRHSPVLGVSHGVARHACMGLLGKKVPTSSTNGTHTQVAACPR